MARYLVTGGAGFIGSHVVDALAARGDGVRVVDDLSTGSADNLVGHPDVELIEADLADRQVAEAAVAGIECAIHLAAIPSVPRSIKEPRRAHRANVDATHELLVAAVGAGVRRVVLASSSSVYGESETLPKHEALRPVPLSPYALHKLVGEQYAALFSRLCGLETVALRFFNVFGPRQAPHSQYSGVISLFFGCPASRSGGHDPRGRRANARLYVRDGRCARRPGGVRRTGGNWTGHQYRTWWERVGERHVRDVAAHHRRGRPSPPYAPASGRCAAFASRHIAGPRSARLRSCCARRRGAAAHGGVAAGAGQPYSIQVAARATTAALQGRPAVAVRSHGADGRSPPPSSGGDTGELFVIDRPVKDARSFPALSWIARGSSPAIGSG